MEGWGILPLLMLFEGCRCPMQETHNEYENVAQIWGGNYEKDGEIRQGYVICKAYDISQIRTK
jgi:hypothetical protein